MFYPEICDRYSNILLDAALDLKKRERSEGGLKETTIPHLLWMLTELQTSTSMSETKRHRWLGYVQGVMVMRGFITVDEERESTRSIFRGK